MNGSGRPRRREPRFGAFGLVVEVHFGGVIGVYVSGEIGRVGVPHLEDDDIIGGLEEVRRGPLLRGCCFGGVREGRTFFLFTKGLNFFCAPIEFIGLSPHL